MAIKEIVTENLVGGIIGGLIGFFSAWCMLKLTEWRRDKNESKELIDKLYLELSRNWFSLAMDIKDNYVGLHKLSNRCWNIDMVSKIDIADSNLIGGLELLHKEITSFNSICDIGITEKLYNLRTVSVIDKFKADDNKIPKALLKRIKEFKALVFSELVRLKKRKTKEWDDKELDWRIAKNPYLLDTEGQD